MGDKPYLQIEVDKHYSKVGVITRIEAFLNSISHRPPARLPEKFDILDVKMKAANIREKPDKSESGKKLLIPDIGWYTRYIADYFKQQGVNAEAMEHFTHESLALGRAEMNSKEYLPLPMLVGACLQAIRKNKAAGGRDADLQFLIPYGYGADADGQYARTVRTILDRLGYTECGIVAPMLEEIPDEAADIKLLIRALLTGDILYAMAADEREKLAPETIPTLDELVKLAEKVKHNKGRIIAAVGSPMCVTSLDEGVLAQIESESNTVCRMPLSEMMRFLWKDNGRNTESSQTEAVADVLSKNGIKLFTDDMDALFRTAQSSLDGFAGNHGRYRFAKALEMGRYADAVLIMSPRYENSAVVLQLRGIQQLCDAPLFEVSLDGDWDENSWSRLRSFLYYC